MRWAVFCIAGQVLKTTTILCTASHARRYNQMTEDDCKMGRRERVHSLRHFCEPHKAKSLFVAVVHTALRVYAIVRNMHGIPSC
ncbi:hypothetical protein BKA63DRAFT_140630 [Paraphoma chrysanthemicola]|nr:hypothetical protein BKA63DRAFT_140630 [Paraphoma chrysanthemicola]